MNPLERFFQRLQTGRDFTLGVSAKDDARRSVYRHGPSLPKPGFHPLITPRGHVLTGWEMSDHVWHRGLWFSIKLINGDNFWEENVPPFGVQTTTDGPHREVVGDDVVRIRHGLRWDSPSGDAVLSESRNVTLSLSADNITTVDWETTLHAFRDLTLDRTPFTTWGGYGGLSLRCAREMHEVDFLLPTGRTVPGITGDSYPWVVLQGRMDEGLDDRVSVCFIDHPRNAATPVSWYTKSSAGFTFINAAFLFHGPQDMAAGTSLHLRYRLHYRDGLWPVDEVDAMAADFHRS